MRHSLADSRSSHKPPKLSRVDLRDLAEFQNVYTDTYFVYGPWLEDKEAAHIAIELSGALRTPVRLFERIHRDLLTIRANFPEFENVVYDGPPNPRRLNVRPVDGEWGDVLQELARYYRADVECSGSYCTVVFCDQLNMELMAALWERFPQVEDAETTGHFHFPSCPRSGLWVEISYGTLIYNFWCCSSCWRYLAFEMSESNQILSIVVSHPYDCVPDCP